jgi:hypothetical protein
MGVWMNETSARQMREWAKAEARSREASNVSDPDTYTPQFPKIGLTGAPLVPDAAEKKHEQK